MHEHTAKAPYAQLIPWSAQGLPGVGIVSGHAVHCLPSHEHGNAGPPGVVEHVHICPVPLHGSPVWGSGTGQPEEQLVEHA